MRSIKKWLIVNQKGEVRVVARKPRNMAWNSFAFPLTINIPDPKAQPGITLDMPEMTEGQVVIHDLDILAGA